METQATPPFPTKPARPFYLRWWFILPFALIVAICVLFIVNAFDWPTKTKRLCKETASQHYDSIVDECLHVYTDGGKECTKNTDCTSGECSVDHLMVWGNTNRSYAANFDDNGFLVGKCVMYEQADPATGQVLPDERVKGCGLVEPFTRDQFEKGERTITSCLKPAIM